MKSLERWSAPFTPGVINADGLRKLLGASDHDALSLLVRETIQNSWDASRDHNGRPVSGTEVPYFGLSLRTMPEKGRSALDHLLGGEANVPGLPELRRTLDDPNLRVLEIADRHTTGLGGPVDNRKPLGDYETHDFVNLVFNIGAPQDTSLGGGTFGFGKVAAYAMSAAATILIISRPLEPDGSIGETRLIGSAIGDDYDDGGLRYTGRHWWGRHGEGTVLPVFGDEADRLAANVFAHPPPPGVSGTTILVVAPDLAGLPRYEDEVKTGLTPDEAASRMVSALLWSAWPKLLPLDGCKRPPMEVEVLLEGKRQELPDPATTHPFIGFSHSLQAVRREQNLHGKHRRDPHGLRQPDDAAPYVVREAMEVFRTQRPKQDVGVAVLAETMRVPGTPTWKGDPLVAESMGVSGEPRHLSLMRQAELVVRYDEGPEHPDLAMGMSWGGVFRTEIEVDDAFAAAEPPTHDRWVAGGLGRPRSTFVRQANKNGPRGFYERAFAESARPDAGGTGDLARLVSSHLGGLLEEGEAPRRSNGGRGGGGGKRTGISVLSSQHRLLEDRLVIAVEFIAPRDANVRVRAAVALAGGGTDPEMPVETIGFSTRHASGPDITGIDTIRTDGSPLTAWVAQPGDATVRITVAGVD